MGIKKVFMDLDYVMCKKLIEEKWNDGSTCVTVTFKNTGEMICAHVGDSRVAARVNGRSDVELTVDHDPGVNKNERKRIEDRGGAVSFHKGCYRVNNNLSVSRAFGDVNLKKGVLEREQTLVDCDPDVSVRKPWHDLDWLIVASDGLYHLMDNKDVLKMAASHLTGEDAALALLKEIDTNARSQLKGHDNTTIAAIHMYHGMVPAAYRVRMPEAKEVPAAEEEAEEKTEEKPEEKAEEKAEEKPEEKAEEKAEETEEKTEEKKEEATPAEAKSNDNNADEVSL